MSGLALGTDIEAGADAAKDADVPKPSDPKDPKDPKGGKRRKERKGTIFCPGCDEYKAAELFDFGNAVDKECKKRLDRIYHQCKTQGKLEWFKQQRATPKGTKKMLDFYRHVEDSCGIKKAVKFCVAQFQHEHAAEQSIDFAGEGEMMWERQAIEYWTSVPGGALSQDDAQARWNDWSSHYLDREIIHDEKSPNPKKPLRLRIPTKDSVNFVNRSIDAKRTVATETPVKKPKEADLEKMQARLSVGFGSGTGGGDIARQQTAQAMVSAGAGQAFADVAMKFSDITILAGAQKKDSGEVSDGDAADADDDAGGEGHEAES